MSAKKKPRVIYVAKHRTGKSSRAHDLRYKAMAPGMRVSASGRKYYENRRNRSDVGML